jgi:LEA14-like dessication related protein
MLNPSINRTTLTKRFFMTSAILLLASCATLEQQIKQHVKQPEINYKSIALGDITQETITLKPTFSITNPNLYSVPVNAVSYQLVLNEQQIVAGETSKVGSLAPNTPKNVTLDLAVTKQALDTFKQALFNDKRLDYKISGAVDVMGFSIPFTQSATLFVPKVSLDNISIEKANASEVTLMMRIAVNNKNDFVLPLDDITYAISTDSKSLISGKLSQQKITKGTNIITVPLTLKTTQLVTNLFSLLKNPNLPLAIKVQSPLFEYHTTQKLNLSNLF